MASRSCKNHSDCFCYICGKYKTIDNKNSITDFVRKAYFAYFGIKLRDQDQQWAPHVVCKTCVERLRLWTSGTRQSMGFGIPMVWREPTNHVDDCYFCSINVTGVNEKKRKSSSYRSFPSAIRPVAHGADIPMPEFKNLLDLSIDENSEEEQHDYRELIDVNDDDKNCACPPIPVLFEWLDKRPQLVAQGRWDIKMMADYCWNLKRDASDSEHSRKSRKRRFLPQ